MKSRVMARKYLREASVLLALTGLACRFLPARRVVAWANRQPRQSNRFAATTYLPMISWAVDRAASRSWSKATCLPRAIAAQAMLRRRGVASRLCLGVAREGDGLIAHAWIEHGDQVVTGGREAPRFKRLAEFGQ